jgi:hypothetical protein
MSEEKEKSRLLSILNRKKKDEEEEEIVPESWRPGGKFSEIEPTQGEDRVYTAQKIQESPSRFNFDTPRKLQKKIPKIPYVKKFKRFLAGLLLIGGILGIFEGIFYNPSSLIFIVPMVIVVSDYIVLTKDPDPEDIYKVFVLEDIEEKV